MCQGLRQHIGPCRVLPVLSLWCEMRGSGKEKAEGNREVEFWERDQALGPPPPPKGTKDPERRTESSKNSPRGFLDRFLPPPSQHLTHN